MSTPVEYNFVIYPEIDGEYDFPEEVRQALVDSPEMDQRFLDESSTDTIGNTLARRTASGRLKAGGPLEPDDLATKQFVDDALADIVIPDMEEGSVQPTADSLARRNSAGRLKATTPVEADDLVNKTYVDDAIDGIVIPESTTGSSEATPATLALRDVQGRFKVADPTLGTHVANKTYVDDAIGDIVIPPYPTGVVDPTGNTIVLRDAGGRIKAALPVSNNDVGTKQYIDEKVADITPPPTSTGGLTAANHGFVFPETYGAVGNGTTSDVSAWQQACNAAAVTGRQVRGIAGKRYLINGLLDLSNINCDIKNDGVFVFANDKDAKISALHNPLTHSSVTAVTRDIIGAVNGEAAMGNSQRVDRITLSLDSQLNRYRVSDKVILYSNDIPADVGSPGNTVGASQHAANMLVLHGIIFPITGATSGLAEGVDIRGGTSQATGEVGSITNHITSNVREPNGEMVLKFITGTFVTGEDILVNNVKVGVISGKGALLSKTRIVDTFTTGIRVRKLANFKTNIEANVDVVGDYENELGVDTHPFMISFGGSSVRPRIKINAFGINGSLLRPVGAFAPIVEVTANGGPNNDPQRAYGYINETRGSTMGGIFKLYANEVRHVYTSNPTNMVPSDTENTILFCGRSNMNTVTGVGINCYSAAWDLHDGANATTFIDALAYQSSGARRKYSGVSGFQNRGFNTKWIRCVSDGCITGFVDATGNDLAPFFSQLDIQQCSAFNVQDKGFHIANDMEQRTINGVPNVRNHRVVCRDLTVIYERDTASAYTDQIAFDFASGDVHMYGTNVAIGFNHAPLRWKKNTDAVTARFYLEKLVADYVGSGSGATGIQIAETGHTMYVDNVTFINKSGVAVPSIFRGVGGSPVVRIANPPVVHGQTSVPALISNASGVTATASKAVTVPLP